MAGHAGKVFVNLKESFKAAVKMWEKLLINNTKTGVLYVTVSKNTLIKNNTS